MRTTLNNKPNILIFVDWFLPGFKAGGPIRSCANLIDHLHKHFNFYVVTRNTDYQSSDPYELVSPNKWLQTEFNASVFYLDSQNLNAKMLNKLLNEREYQWVYINGIFSWYFSILPLWLAKKSGIARMVAVRGMLASGALGLKSTKKHLFLLVAKLVGLYNGCKFHATNQQEADEINKQISGKAIVQIAPNLHKKTVSVQSVQVSKQVNELKLVSVARIAPEKNTLFALEILKCINCPDATIEFNLYGSIYDQEYWNACQQVIANLPDNMQVNYKGVINPDKIEQVIQNHHFLFLPTLGENFGHVILESFLAGRPVIISNKTPWRELQKDSLGWDLHLDKETFVETINACVRMNSDEFELLVEACKSKALEITDDKEIIQKSINLFS